MQRLDRGLRRRLVRRTPVRRALASSKMCFDRRGALFAGRGADHEQTVATQPFQNGAADAATRAGDQRDLAFGFSHGRPRPSAASNASTRTDRERRHRAIDSLDQSAEHFAGTALDQRRRAAGHHRFDALRPANRLRQLRDEIGANPFRIAARRTHRRSEPPVLAAPSTGVCASTSANLAAAPIINAQCDGTLTASLMARFAPAAEQRSIAASTAAAVPAITICPGALMFAADTTPPASAQHCATSGSSRPRIAAIAPAPAGTASCINRPRVCTRRTASAKSIAPAATNAEYSPRLCPAIADGVAPPRSIQHRHSATLAVSNARLSDLGAPQRFFGTFQRDRCAAGRRSPSSASAKQSRTTASRFQEVAQHADFLRTLTRKNETDGHVRHACSHAREMGRTDQNVDGANAPSLLHRSRTFLPR